MRKKDRISVYMISLLVGLLCSIILDHGDIRAQANLPPHFEKVFVTLQPEYDQPSILVSYEISLPHSTLMPSEVVVKLPQGVHNLVSLTELIPEHEFSPGEYEIVKQGDETELRFSPQSKDFQVLFYDLNLVKDGSKRNYVFHWNSRIAVNNFHLRVLRPVGASEVEIDPTLSINVIGSNGIEYYENNFGRIEAGEEFVLNLTYIKDIGDLDNPALAVVSGDPIDNFTAGQTPKPDSLMLTLLSVSSTFVLGLLIFFSLRFAAVRKKKVSASVLPADKQTIAKRPYCLECGQRLEKDDRFCRSCGAVVR